MEKVAKLSELKDKLCVVVKGKDLALFKVKGKVFCVDNACTHLGGPLCKGIVEDFVVECPWHGAKFDVRDGSVKGPPARTSVKSYKVVLKGDDVLVDC